MVSTMPSNPLRLCPESPLSLRSGLSPVAASSSERYPTARMRPQKSLRSAASAGCATSWGPRYPSPATDGEGRRTAISLPRLAAPQPHDKSSTEQFDTRPSMMRRPNSQQPVMADSSVGYVRGPLKARKSLWRPIKRSRVQRPEPCIWNVRAVMVKPLYKTGFNCRAWVGDA
jgi:hypothetical protein